VDAADCNKQPVCVWRQKNKPADRCAQLPDQCAKLSGTTCQNHPDCDWQPKSKKCNLKASASIATTNFTPKPTAAPTLAPTRTSCSYAVDAADCNKQSVCVWRQKNKPADRCAQLPNQCAKLSGTTCQNHPDCDWQPKSKKCNLKASASISTTNFTPKPTAAPK
jgi:hypothetical protein